MQLTITASGAASQEHVLRSLDWIKRQVALYSSNYMPDMAYCDIRAYGLWWMDETEGNIFTQLWYYSDKTDWVVLES